MEDCNYGQLFCQDARTEDLRLLQLFGQGKIRRSQDLHMPIIGYCNFWPIYFISPIWLMHFFGLFGAIFALAKFIWKVFKDCSNEICSSEIRIRLDSPVYILY